MSKHIANKTFRDLNILGEYLGGYSFENVEFVNCSFKEINFLPGPKGLKNVKFKNCTFEDVFYEDYLLACYSNINAFNHDVEFVSCSGESLTLYGSITKLSMDGCAFKDLSFKGERNISDLDKLRFTNFRGNIDFQNHGIYDVVFDGEGPGDIMIGFCDINALTVESSSYSINMLQSSVKIRILDNAVYSQKSRVRISGGDVRGHLVNSIVRELDTRSSEGLLLENCGITDNVTLDDHSFRVENCHYLGDEGFQKIEIVSKPIYKLV